VVRASCTAAYACLTPSLPLPPSSCIPYKRRRRCVFRMEDASRQLGDGPKFATGLQQRLELRHPRKGALASRGPRFVWMAGEEAGVGEGIDMTEDCHCHVGLCPCQDPDEQLSGAEGNAPAPPAPARLALWRGAATAAGDPEAAGRAAPESSSRGDLASPASAEVRADAAEADASADASADARAEARARGGAAEGEECGEVASVASASASSPSAAAPAAAATFSAALAPAPPSLPASMALRCTLPDGEPGVCDGGAEAGAGTAPPRAPRHPAMRPRAGSGSLAVGAEKEAHAHLAAPDAASAPTSPMYGPTAGRGGGCCSGSVPRGGSFSLDSTRRQHARSLDEALARATPEEAAALKSIQIPRQRSSAEAASSREV